MRPRVHMRKQRRVLRRRLMHSPLRPDKMIRTDSLGRAQKKRRREDSARIITPTLRTRLLHGQELLRLGNLQIAEAIHPDLRQKRIMAAQVRIAVAVRQITEVQVHIPTTDQHITEVRRNRKKHSPSVQKRKRACMASCRWFLALSAH